MFILGETTSSIWPSIWSASAATFSAIAASISGIISYKSFTHQKTKDEINLKPNLFVKGNEFSIYCDTRDYLNINCIQGSNLRDIFPFKFIEFQNLSNEPIVDLTVISRYKLQSSEEQIKELQTENALLKYKIDNNKIDNNKIEYLSVFTNDNEKETTKVGLIEGKERFIVGLPDNIILDLWENYININNIEDTFSLNIEFDFKYSHSYNDKPVQFVKNIIIKVSGYKPNATNLKLEYETYVFPKK